MFCDILLVIYFPYRFDRLKLVQLELYKIDEIVEGKVLQTNWLSFFFF